MDLVLPEGIKLKEQKEFKGKSNWFKIQPFFNLK